MFFFSFLLRSRLRLAGLSLLLLFCLLAGSSGFATPAQIAQATACSITTHPASDLQASIYNEESGLVALNAARAKEGLGALNLPADFLSRSPAERILLLFNQERLSRGLNPFNQNNPVLAQVALNHSQVLIDFGFFAHNDGVDGTSATRITTAPGIATHYSGWGEIIAGAPYSTYMVWLWLYADSSSNWGHRYNIFGCYDTVGIGYAPGGLYGAISTADFIQSVNNYQPLAVAADTTQPVLVLNQGQFNNGKSQQLTISATATDSGSGMRHVAFFLDNQGFNALAVTPAIRSGNSFSYVFGSVSPGNHTVTAVAVDVNNNYIRSDIMVLDDFYQPPTAPTNLTAQAVSTSQINLNWTNQATNQTGFELQRSLDQTNWSTVVTQTGTSFQNSGLTPGTLYYYRVLAKNNQLNSAFSNIAQAATPLPAPDGLSLLAGSPDYAQINLSWTSHSTNESGFEIQRTTNGGTWTSLATVGAGVTVYEDKTVWPTTQYTYRVRAFNAVATSLFSNSAALTTGAVPVSNTVSNPDDYGAPTDSNNQGTLTYALLHTPSGQAIAFSVMTVTVHSALPVIDLNTTHIYLNPAGSCTTPVTIIYAGSLPGPDFIFNQGSYLKALRIRGFRTVQFGVGLAGGEHLQCVGVRKT